MENLIYLVLLLALFAAVLVRVRKLVPRLNGMTGEGLVKRELEAQLPKPAYDTFHDVTLPWGAGTTQIDHIVVSEFGVFVIETKDRSGWISGSQHQDSWTQRIRGRPVSFQNPLRKNQLNIGVLGELLRLEPEVLHSVVVFTGGALFNSSMPENVMKIGGLIPFIMKQSSRVITPPNVQRLSKVLGSRRLSSSAATVAVGSGEGVAPEEKGSRKSP